MIKGRKIERALLIYPPVTFSVQSMKQCHLPLGIAYLASAIRDICEVYVLDCAVEGYENEERVGERFLRYGLGFDEIEKRKYLLTFSIYTLRELIKEHLDLKLVKNLYLLLSKKLPREFFKGVFPKHSILASQDIILDLLSEKEKIKLPSFLKAKHIILPFKFEGNCEEIINILSFLPNIYILKKGNPYQVFTTFSISEFVIFSLNLKQKDILKNELENILENVKILFPDCFGEI